MGKKSTIRSGFSRCTVEEIVCDLQCGSSIPVSPDNKSDKVVLESCVNNIARNKKMSFKLLVTLWVYGMKVQAEALVDSGATTNFIDKSFVERNHLVTNKLATPYVVKNADGTLNVSGDIKEYVRAYLQIGTHKTVQYLYVTQLGDKDMMIGYSYLHKHNPEIDWQSGEWMFTRCPEICANRTCKIQLVEAGADELQLEQDLPWESSLDILGEEDCENPYINWIDINNPHSNTQAAVVATMLDENDMDEENDEEDEDTIKWKLHVPPWLHDYGTIFSKKKSE